MEAHGSDPDIPASEADIPEVEEAPGVHRQGGSFGCGAQVEENLDSWRTPKIGEAEGIRQMAGKFQRLECGGPGERIVRQYDMPFSDKKSYKHYLWVGGARECLWFKYNRP